MYVSATLSLIWSGATRCSCARPLSPIVTMACSAASVEEPSPAERGEGGGGGGWVGVTGRGGGQQGSAAVMCVHMGSRAPASHHTQGTPPTPNSGIPRHTAACTLSAPAALNQPPRQFGGPTKRHASLPPGLHPAVTCKTLKPFPPTQRVPCIRHPMTRDSTKRHPSPPPFKGHRGLKSCKVTAGWSKSLHPVG